MAVQYVDITSLSEYTESDLNGNEPIYTITAFASNNNPSASQVWFFIDAELYRLRTE